jgi:radical SAM superfamily enzyme YgiQ (UPF0313 family)
MKQKVFYGFIAVLVIISNLSFEINRTLVITGTDYSGNHAATYVLFPSGKVALVRDGETQTFQTGLPCQVSYKMDMGWLYTTKKPTTKLVIGFKKVEAIKPEKFLLLFIVGERKRKVILNYPPANSPWHLPAGISQLSSVLQNAGHEVFQRYSHILGVEYLLKEYGGEDAGWALRTIRDPSSNILDLYRARMIFENISRAIPTADKFAVVRNNVSYVSQYGSGTLEAIRLVIQNRERHLWYDYFIKVEIPIMLDFQPDIYGISIADERQLIPGLILASLVKDTVPQTLVVLGGNFWSRVPHLYSDPEFAKFFRYFDAIIYREGFQPLQILATTLNPAVAPSTVWQNGDRLVINSLPSLPTNFETLLTPNFDSAARQWSPDIVYPFYTMSNCPRSCGFCAISAGSDTYGKKPRVMSPARIAYHMQQLGRRFDITDETFSVQRQLALGDELRRIGHKAEWQCYMTISSELLNLEICRQLYDAGCRAVQLGLESLSPKTLRRECKAWNQPGHYGRILQNLKEAGIQTHVFLMTSLPGEPLTDSLRWLPFLRQHGDSILTIKAGRYRLARMSSEEQVGSHSQYITVLPDTKPLHLNKDFHYKDVSGKRVDAIRDLLEQACREHWAYGITSTLPWWMNRGRYSWEQLRQMTALLPPEPPVSHLNRVIAKIKSIIRDELGKEVNFNSFKDIVDFSSTI